jgi:hypothetical protein
VTVSGSGEEVKTVNLERGGYTVQYTDTTGYLIVEPVERDGSTGVSIINASSMSGVTTYASTGPVTIHARTAVIGRCSSFRCRDFAATPYRVAAGAGLKRAPLTFKERSSVANVVCVDSWRR